jgi:hypothetical protein
MNEVTIVRIIAGVLFVIVLTALMVRLRRRKL